MSGFLPHSPQDQLLGLPPTRRPIPPDPQHVASMHGTLVEAIGSGIALGTVTGTLDRDDIAAHFGVSRSLVREALRTLAAKGMVTARQRAGTQVAPPSSWAALDEHVIRWRAAGPDRFKQLYESLEIRERLEPLAARRMATLADPHWLGEITAAAEAIAAASRSQQQLAMMKADTAFHRALYLGSGSALLAELSGTVHACLRVPDFQSVERFPPETAHRHDTLAAAILSGDGDAAEEACRVAAAATRQMFTSAHALLLDGTAQVSKGHVAQAV